MNNAYSNTSKSNAPIKESVSIWETFKKTLYNWPWLLLSVVICCALGMVYIMRTPPLYEQSAVMIIHDDEEGGSVNKDLSQIGLFQNNTNLQNEVATLSSPDLMAEVVEILNLNYNYQIPGMFHDQVAYGKKLPVKVSITGISPKADVSFDISIDKTGAVSITDYKVREGKEKIESTKTFKGYLNKPIKISSAEITISPTDAFVKGKEVGLSFYKIPVFNSAAAFSSHLTITPDEDGGTVVKLSLTDHSIERADDILSTLIKVYRENWIDEKNQMAIATSNFINERLKVIEEELGDVDTDISQYKSSHLVPNVEQAANSYIAENQKLSNDILNLSSELQMAKYLRDYVESPANKNVVLPSGLGLMQGDYSSAIDNYNTKLIERNNLAAKSSDSNPMVMSLDADLAGLRGAIVRNIDNSIVRLRTQINDLQGARGETREKISTNPTQAKYLLSVERQQKVKENLYLFLLQKREDNEINQAFTAQNFRLIQRPGGSELPIAPKRRIIFLSALLIGILIPFGYQYYKILTDTKVHGRSDCTALTMPLLGEIPLYKGKEDPQKEILVKPAKRDVLNESFRVLRTNIDFVKSEKDGEAFTLAITSINPGSGKSFIAVNIGTAIAIRNNRVLVIDTDLRRGSTSAYAGSPKKGLSDYLAGKTTDVHELIVTPLGNDGPDVLPIGSIPPNPTELIETPLFGEMMDKLKKEYDYIICDCPPIEIVADTRIIDKYVDRTVFIVRAGLLDKAALPEIDRLYTEKQYTNMVYIINGTRTEGAYGKKYGSYGYGYGYGQAYGYGYGHGERGDKTKR